MPLFTVPKSSAVIFKQRASEMYSLHARLLQVGEFSSLLIKYELAIMNIEKEAGHSVLQPPCGGCLT